MNNETKKEIPTSPNDMPLDYNAENPNWRWNVIATLNQFASVDLHWENDEAAAAITGEPSGQWDVTIETRHRRQFRAKHEDIENALWYVTTLAENSDSEEWKKLDAEREAALAKLTPAERRLLRLR